MTNLIENYLYLFHLDKFVLLPTYPDSVQDQMSATFTPANPLMRSAPIFAYSYSGPRTIQVNLSLHRDMMTQLNYGVSNLNLDIGDDYIDTLIKDLQTMVLPRYDVGVKMVNPPMVALRFGNDIYIKGICNGPISVTYSGPILEGNKYALVNISFNISEVDPYSAESVATLGSFRGINKTLERRLFKS